MCTNPGTRAVQRQSSAIIKYSSPERMLCICSIVNCICDLMSLDIRIIECVLITGTDILCCLCLWSDNVCMKMNVISSSRTLFGVQDIRCSLSGK